MAVTVSGVAVCALIGAVPVSPARAANSPTFRDCSLLVGLDPDFVQLYGVTLRNGSLTVAANHPTVQVEASESADPGDSGGHVTLGVTVAADGANPTTTVGGGTGLVILDVALPGSKPGRTYTLSWSATFDNGMHACPAVYTLANTPSNPSPFTVTVTP